MDSKKKFNERLQVKLDQKTDKMSKMVSRSRNRAKSRKTTRRCKWRPPRRRRWSASASSGTTRAIDSRSTVIALDTITRFSTKPKTLAKYETEASYASWKVLAEVHHRSETSLLWTRRL